MFASVSGRIRADKRGQAAGQAKSCSRPGSRSGSSLLRSVKSSRQGSEDIMNTRLGLVLALVMAGQEENPWTRLQCLMFSQECWQTPLLNQSALTSSAPTNWERAAFSRSVAAKNYAATFDNFFSSTHSLIRSYLIWKLPQRHHRGGFNVTKYEVQI